MKRRTFIDHVIKAAALSSLAPSLLTIELKSKYKLGYQLYSIRDEMAKAPIETLKVLKSMGYQDFEAYGFDADKGSFYGIKSSEFKKILDDLDISVTSGHYGFAPFLDRSNDDLRRFVDRCIVGAKDIDSTYITWPWIAPEQRNMENFKRMIPMLNRIGEQVTSAGLGFAYHNHGFEFEDHNGETGYELILSETDPSLVKLQMDMYWVMHSSNFTPADLIKSQPGRFVMWHIKDMDKVTRDYTELGNGSIDYTKLLPDPQESGLQFYYLEQGGNFAHNSTQSARDSAIYFKKYLEHKI
jgi:sugar phosphate isomerase/epimerase